MEERQRSAAHFFCTAGCNLATWDLLKILTIFAVARVGAYARAFSATRCFFFASTLAQIDIASNVNVPFDFFPHSVVIDWLSEGMNEAEKKERKKTSDCKTIVIAAITNILHSIKQQQQEKQQHSTLHHDAWDSFFQTNFWSICRTYLNFPCIAADFLNCN